MQSSEQKQYGIARRGRLLVIDDEPLLGQTLRLALSSNHDVTVIESGRRALERLALDARYDLVLCDLMMPDMSGIDVYERILQEHPQLASKIMFMSGGAFTRTMREFVAAHPELVLEKPFDMAQVERLLERQISVGSVD